MNDRTDEGYATAEAAVALPALLVVLSLAIGVLVSVGAHEPGHRKFPHFRGCADGKFHAEEFDLKAVNKALERVRWPVKHRR